jgi:hypothetical protein
MCFPLPAASFADTPLSLAVVRPAPSRRLNLRKRALGGVDVRKNECLSRQTPITAIFWDGLTAGSAVTALLRVGFPDTDVYAVGVLTGPVPDLTDFLASLGIPAVDALFYNDCFQDGAILVIIRSRAPRDERRAREVMLRHGGVLPPSCQLLSSAEQ